jgi:hypothetical protein
LHIVYEKNRADNKDDAHNDKAACCGKNEYETVDKEAEEKTGNAS